MGFVRLDWEIHEQANDLLYSSEREYIELQQLNKQLNDEATHNTRTVRRAHQAKLQPRCNLPTKVGCGIYCFSLLTLFFLTFNCCFSES